MQQHEGLPRKEARREVLGRSLDAYRDLRRRAQPYKSRNPFRPFRPNLEEFELSSTNASAEPHYTVIGLFNEIDVHVLVRENGCNGALNSPI